MANKASTGGHSSGHERYGSQSRSRAGRTQVKDRQQRLTRRDTKAVSRERTAADRAWLDAESARVQAIVAEWTAEVRERQAAARARGEKLPPLPLHDLTNRTAGDLERWNVGQAGQLLDDGYALEYVCRRTGWGGWWFKNRVGNDGYAQPVVESRWSA